MYLLTDLKRNDLFRFDKRFGSLERFHSLEQIDNRYLIKLISLNYMGDINTCNAYAFIWRDNNDEIFIPKFYLSEHKKNRGLPCIPVSNERRYFNFKLNDINISDIYCNNSKYWYNDVNYNPQVLT